MADDLAALVRAYYRAVDRGAYDDLRALLAPGFRQVRGDRTLDGRDAFVAFMRDERPETDTVHVVEGVYVPADGPGPVAPGADVVPEATDARADVLAQGRLHRADGSLWFRFVDAFDTGEDRLAGLRTYAV